eukprot:gb/GECG01007055.1/.p1 GENE.gb/GECG01007055.1/~~gb/GECG01007055.1/.p1  ORF type:complete len:310 (+),score=32.44 gb/GECG01007055.1/:1-930(+)
MHCDLKRGLGIEKPAFWGVQEVSTNSHGHMTKGMTLTPKSKTISGLQKTDFRLVYSVEGSVYDGKQHFCRPYRVEETHGCIHNGSPGNLGRQIVPIRPLGTFTLSIPSGKESATSGAELSSKCGSAAKQSPIQSKLPLRKGSSLQRPEAISHQIPYSSPPTYYRKEIQRTSSGRTALQYEVLQRETLKEWMQQHWAFPYPGPQSLSMLGKETGLSPQQLENWFRNERRRHWRPYMEKNYPRAAEFAEGVRGTKRDGGVPSLPRNMLDIYVEAASIAKKRWGGNKPVDDRKGLRRVKPEYFCKSVYFRPY